MLKSFNIMGVEKSDIYIFCFFFGEGVHEIIFFGRGWVNCLKMGLGKFTDLRGDLAKEGVVFLRWGGVETSMHTMSWRSLLIDTNIQSK